MYKSTRTHQEPVSFEHALLEGLAPDGGLYVPMAIPKLPEDWQDTTTFADLGFKVLKSWLKDEITDEDLNAICQDALNFEVPVVKLPDNKLTGKDTYVLELIHGQTLSFKDFGARTMARLMGHFLKKTGKKLTILVATSGDTGSAVADGFSGQDNIEVILLYPKGMVSPVQEWQLITKRKGVRAFAVEGTFDDCQRMVKEAFVAKELAHLPLSSANSINIGRLLPQSLYYLWAYKTLGLTGEVVFCTPSGNLGNVTGGIFAKEGGLPVHQFVVGHNANNFYPKYLADGTIDYQATIPTLSNAMDVGVPSNFERLKALFSLTALQEMFKGYSVSDEETLDAMRQMYQETGYVACPHTAVGFKAVSLYRKETGNTLPTLILSTAHPAKFPEVVTQALKIEAPTAESLEILKTLPTNVKSIAPTLAALSKELLP